MLNFLAGLPLTIAAAVFVLGVLIFVHELGHFIAAKAVGVGVPRFSLGLGPVTPIRWKWGETEYVLSWIPFGGYVKMATAEDEEQGVMAALEGGAASEGYPPDKLFENKPLWARIIVIIAGVTMNVLFAWLVFTGLAATYGMVESPVTAIASVDSSALPARASGLRSLPFGTQIVRINGDTMASAEAIRSAIGNLRSDSLRFEFSGGTAPVTVNVPGIEAHDRAALLRALRFRMDPKIGMVAPGKPAAAAGIAPGDVIVRAGGDSIRDWSEFVKVVEGRAGQPVALRLQRGDSVLNISVVPAAEQVKDSATGETRTVGRIGVSQVAERRYVRYNLPEAVVAGGRETLNSVGMVWFTLRGLASGKVPAREIGGPILIGQLAGQFARAGMDVLLNLMGFLSVNLAVLNLLPVPVLDGGHLLFLVIEGAIRRPLSLKVRLRLSQAGMVLLIGLMLFALTNDMMRIFSR